MASRPSRDIYAETLAVFDRSEHRYEPLTTPEVANALDAERRTVYKRLQKLVDRGAIETKKTGSNSRVWWRPPPDGSTTTSSAGDGGRDSASERGPSGGSARHESEKTESEPPRSVGRERELAQRSRAMESAIDGMAITNEDGEYIYVNETHADVYGYDDREAFLGEHWRMCYHEDELPRFEDDIFPTLYEEGAWRGEAIGQRKDGTTFPQELSLTVTDDDDIICVVRDVTDRKNREREVREKARQLQGILDTVEAAIFLKDADGRYLLLNQNCRTLVGVEDDEDVVGLTDADLFPEDVATQYRADDDRVFEANETIEIEEEVPTPDGRRTHLTRKTPIFDEEGEPYAVCAVSTDITDRMERERELERQRDQLTALDHLNGVVRGITEAVIDQSTREEIEQVVCDRLTESDSYRFAWICAVDPDMRLKPRVEAGIDGYLEEVPLSANPDDPAGRGPAGKAVRTQEIQTTQNAFDDPHFEPWREYAREYGYRSSAAIPLVHEDTLYGVLGVYSERPDAFAEEVREVVGQLGEVIGHAIAAVERKRALMSDEVVALEVRIPELLESRDTSVPTDGTITVDRTIPLGNDEYLLYGTTTADAMEVVHALGEQLSDWKTTRTIDETDGKIRFEQHLSDSPMASIVADHGGRFKGGTIEDGTYSATIHLPPGTDIRRVVAGLREKYPTLETISQQQVTREEPSAQQTLSALTEKLTDRQRAALEAGYFGGFFEWPRERSGENVADSLDIGASTFHQHVRKAEKKLLDEVFGDT